MSALCRVEDMCGKEFGYIAVMPNGDTQMFYTQPVFEIYDENWKWISQYVDLNDAIDYGEYLRSQGGAVRITKGKSTVRCCGVGTVGEEHP